MERPGFSTELRPCGIVHHISMDRDIDIDVDNICTHTHNKKTE